MRRAEGRAVAFAAAASAALCEADAEDLSSLTAEAEAEGERESEVPVPRARRGRSITVLLPPLRREFAEMPPPPSLDDEEERGEEGEGERESAAATAAAPSESESGKENDGGGRSGSGRRQRRRARKNRKRLLLLCCVRLSPEKEPHRFVEVAESLARSGVLSELGVVPALVGGGDSDYARGLRERMAALPEARGGDGPGARRRRRRGARAVVEGGFVGSAELASRFFDRTLLNFHPCLADAYGMSAVEAGSRGAPSVIHRSGSLPSPSRKNGGGKSRITVGASALLRAEEGESIALDLSLPADEVAARVAELLRGERAAAKAKAKSKETISLSEVGERAQRRARSWGERKHGEALAALARGVVGGGAVFETAQEKVLE